MIIKGLVLIILTLGMFIFLGIKMGESVQPQFKILFFTLFLMSLLTAINIIISVYFAYKLHNKRGPPGKKGKKGETGDNGENGVCDKSSCIKKSIETMIVNKIMETSKIPLHQYEYKLLCNFLKKLNYAAMNLDNLKTVKTSVSNLVFTASESERNKDAINSILLKLNTLRISLGASFFIPDEYKDLTPDDFSSC